MARQRRLRCRLILLGAFMPSAVLGQGAQGGSPAESGQTTDCAKVTKQREVTARVVSHHRTLGKAVVCEIRLRKNGQVWLEIPDANEIIYTYGVISKAVVEETAPLRFAAFLRANLSAPLGIVSVRDSGNCRSTNPARPECHAELTQRLRIAAGAAQALVVWSDTLEREPSGGMAEIAASIRKDAGEEIAGAIRGLTLASVADLFAWAKALKDSIEAGSAPPAVKARVRRDQELLEQLYPAAAELLVKLSNFRLGRSILISHDSDGSELIRLTITSRMSEEYRPARPVTGADQGLNVFYIRSAVPWFQVSTGLSLTPFNERESFHERTNGDTTFFEAKRRDRLSLVPTTFFQVQHTLGGDFVGGVGIGLGVRIGDADVTLGDAIEYSAFLTVGFRWLRLHLGAAWPAEVDSDGLPPKDASGRRFTTSHLRLEDFATRRNRYVLLGVSYTP